MTRLVHRISNRPVTDIFYVLDLSPDTLVTPSHQISPLFLDQRQICDAKAQSDDG
jgi:hypothetical protein